MIVPAQLPTITDQPYRIALVGEAPADEEALTGRPFVGSAGRELNSQLSLAGIMRGACLVANVFDTVLPENDIGAWCMSAPDQKKLLKMTMKEQGAYPPHWIGEFEECPALVDDILRCPVERGKYLHPNHWHHVARLRRELLRYEPNLIVPMGNTALWAVTGHTGIEARRGAMHESVLVPGVKVLPTYHPAFILRAYDKRSASIADFMRARREGEFPDVRMVRRELWLDPTLEDLAEFKARFLDPADLISFDIETARGQVECISFAPSPTLGIIVPFVDWRQKSHSYWETPEEELVAWEFVRDILEGPQRKLAQNGVYDVQWLAERAGIAVRNYSEDTRLQHHALYPEMPKDLGFMGSIYENEGAWKLLRKFKAEKRDE